MNKICFKCGLEKSLDDFYKHKQMEDGHLGKCKICTKNDSKLREEILRKDPNWIEKEKNRHREKYYKLGYKEKHKPSPEKKKEIMKRYIEKYPEKYLAKNAITNFNKNKGFELHHWSYLKEHYKDIIELSIEEHNIIHRYLIYDQERMQYRTIDNILLDTKQSHIDYINQYIK